MIENTSALCWRKTMSSVFRQVIPGINWVVQWNYRQLETRGCRVAKEPGKDTKTCITAIHHPRVHIPQPEFSRLLSPLPILLTQIHAQLPRSLHPSSWSRQSATYSPPPRPVFVSEFLLFSLPGKRFLSLWLLTSPCALGPTQVLATWRLAHPSFSLELL